MKITIDKTVVNWIINNDLWALVELKMDFYLGNKIFDFLRSVNKDDLYEAPKALNLRKLTYYISYRYGIVWYILLEKMNSDWYEVIRIISSKEKDGKYFYDS